ncbi:MAG TPA: hypothetical protein VIQ02_04125 [Jiangellaceae bacterium]
MSRSAGVASGTHTQMAFVVDDIVTEVRELRSQGVVFEEYDLPGLKTVDGIADQGTLKAAWFKDGNGNLLAIMESSRPSTDIVLQTIPSRAPVTGVVGCTGMAFVPLSCFSFASFRNLVGMFRHGRGAAAR